MKLAFFSSSSNGSGGKRKKAVKKASPGLSRSDPPSFGSGSSSSSSDPATISPPVLSGVHTQNQPSPPMIGRNAYQNRSNPPVIGRKVPQNRSSPPVIGRNASCLDAEYRASDTPNHANAAPDIQNRPSVPMVGCNASLLDVEYCTATVSKLRLGEDGKFNKEELRDALCRLGDIEQDELREIFDGADERISLEELIALLRPKQREGGEEIVDEEEAELKEAFQVYDTNGDGKISAEELHGVLWRLEDKSCTVEDCRRIIRVVDSDGDGFVCFKDFSRMMALNRHR